MFVLSPKNFLYDPSKLLAKQLCNFELTYFPLGDRSTPWTLYEPGPGTLSWDVWHLPVYFPKSLAQTVLYLAKKYFPLSFIQKATG